MTSQDRKDRFVDINDSFILHEPQRNNREEFGDGIGVMAPDIGANDRGTGLSFVYFTNGKNTIAVFMSDFF